jgi:flagellar hook-associated protein 3 FlgL
MAIYPIPAGRSSDALVSRRMLAQMQDAQKRLLTVEQQLSTGLRLQLPSDDTLSASRAMTLQRMLETKKQLQTNLSTTKSFLAASDTALSTVGSLLSDVRGSAITATNSTTSDLQRQALAIDIDAAVEELMTIGNQKFRDRYLFGGSPSTAAPFQASNGFVAYYGNNTTLRTYATPETLLSTNVPGEELFGAISTETQGTDLQPNLTDDTRLVDLRGGRGITLGTLVVSDGSHTSRVSIAGAQTIGDVARLLEANPPAGRTISVTVGPRGLRVEIDAAGGGALTISDADGGTTAAELGIRRLAGSASEPIEGGDLNPVLLPTTSLEDILGVRAQAVVSSPGSNNDILLTARDRGAAMNGVAVQFVDDNLAHAAPGLSAGSEYAEFDSNARAAQAGIRLSGFGNDLLLRATSPGTDWNNVTIRLDASQNLGNAANVSYDPNAKTLTIAVDDSDETTLGTLVSAVNNAGQFTAEADASRGEGYDPSTAVLALDAGVLGNTGNSGGAANTVYVYIDVNETTANQAVAALRASSDVAARFDASLDADDTTSASPAGAGLVAVAAHGTTAGGSGTEWDRTSGLQITNGGQTYLIDIHAAETVQDVLNILNNSGAQVLAGINDQRNGISIRSRLSGTDLSIGENGGSTATDLGLRTFALDSALADFNHGIGVRSVEGTDFVIRRNDGVELAIDVSSAATVADVLDLINNHPNNLSPDSAVTARLSALGNGIELVDDNPTGTETLQVRRANASAAAWDLGLVPAGQDASTATDPGETAVAAVAFAAPHDLNTALRIAAPAGGTQWNGIDIEFRNTLVGDTATATYDSSAGRLIIDIADGQTTANTVISAITLEGTFRAELDATHDPTNNGSGTLVAPAGVAATTDGGTPETLSGADTNPIETRGVFNTLLRLRQAIQDYDVGEIERTVALLDDDMQRMSFGRAELGTRMQAVESITDRNDDERIELSAALSTEVDVDLAQAASDYATRQAAYEASLRAVAGLHSLSLMDFL